MAASMKSGVLLSGSSATKSFDLISPACSSIQFAKSEPVASKRVWRPKSFKKISVNASYCGSSRTMRWWEKTMKPNMTQMKSAQELVDALKNAGDRLVVIDFYSPGCGGCRSLHPKICQLAESNPDAIFLKINYEELKKMCSALHIHVLPFFRFYKGSKGRLCSFSCTLSTISKFKEALAKYNNTELKSGLGDRAKGLDESELLNLVAMGEITAVPETPLASQEMDNLFMKIIKNPTLPNLIEELLEAMEDNNPLLVA